MFAPFLLWFESTPVSIWVRESPSIFAFPMILAVHTIGLGLLAGLNAALDLRILGIAKGVPVGEFGRFLPVMWLGLWLNVSTGILLLIAYPTKALTNPVFYLKLALIAAALTILGAVRRRALTEGAAPDRMRALAVWSLVCWAGVITTGRLLAYTHTHLMASSLFE
jgi:hypothetical protein